VLLQDKSTPTTKTKRKMKQTASYTERKKFEIFDKGHVLLYLNEQPAEIATRKRARARPASAIRATCPTAAP